MLKLLRRRQRPFPLWQLGSTVLLGLLWTACPDPDQVPTPTEQPGSPTAVPETPRPDTPTPGTSTPQVTPTLVPVTETPAREDLDGDGYSTSQGDCNDGNDLIYPTAPEACDGVDNDCDNQIDEDGQSTFYADVDNDGFGNPNDSLESCDPVAGYVSVAGDCNDAEASVYFQALELCDGLDNDCDLQVDEDGLTRWYADTDLDGHGSPDAYLDACGQLDAYSPLSDDCDDTDPSAYTGAEERCDGVDNDCDGQVDEDGITTWYLDADRDGHGDPAVSIDTCATLEAYATVGDDCDDTTAAISPDAQEICDGIDNDCDGFTDESLLSVYYLDQDGDGQGTASSPQSACQAPDGYVENARDCNDLDATVSEGALELCDGQDNDCDGLTDEDVQTLYYLDEDGDDHGQAETTLAACALPPGYALQGDDCLDSDLTVYPSAPEVCDGKDNDCDGTVDEDVQLLFYADTDGDLFGESSSWILACEPPTGYVDAKEDCNDTDLTVYPGAAEQCDEQDNDCDGLTDEEVQSTFYADTDTDGHGNASQTILACQAPDGYVDSSDDCDDTQALAYPGLAETCDGIDNNCDQQVDEGVLLTFYQDADNDGHGASSQPTQACQSPAGYVIANDDCNDGQALSFPGNPESCDGIDNDCNGTIDDGVLTTYYADTDGDSFGNASAPREACSLPEGYQISSTDCLDSDALVYPGASEYCDGKDNDCDGDIDAPDPVNGTTFYADLDGDGWGDPNSTIYACSAPEDYVDNAYDCQDDNANVIPGLASCAFATADALSCKDIRDDGRSEGSGYYKITPSQGNTFTVYCDMDTDGGGFTLVGNLYAGSRSPASVYRSARFFTKAFVQGTSSYTLATNQTLILGGTTYGMIDATGLMGLADEVRYSCKDTSRNLYADAIWPVSDADVTELMTTLGYASSARNIRIARNSPSFVSGTTWPTASPNHTWGSWHICGSYEHTTMTYAFQVGLCGQPPTTSDSNMTNINQIAIGFHDGYNGIRLECTADTPPDTPYIEGWWKAWVR